MWLAGRLRVTLAAQAVLNYLTLLKQAETYRCDAAPVTRGAARCC